MTVVGNGMTAVILFPSLKITALIFLEIFLIQYFIVSVEQSMPSSLPSFA